MIESLKLDGLSVKGFARVELYDAETGELTDVSEGYNFISDNVLNCILKQVQKMMFAAGCSNGGIGAPPNFSASNVTSNYDGVFKYLVLTDSALPESPATEISIPGNMVGWASRIPYVGSSVVQGTLNQNESFANEDKVHWVFDFATSVANGTISSICWAFMYPETVGDYLGKAPRIFSTTSKYIGKLSRSYYNQPVYPIIFFFDGHLWCLDAVNRAIIYKIDPITLLEVATYTIKNPNTNYSAFTVRNGYVYTVSTTTNKLYEQNLETGVVRTSTVTLSSSIYCMAVDDTYIYVQGSSQLYRVRITDLVTQDSHSVSYLGVSQTLYNLFFKDGLLYCGVYSIGVYTVDPSTGIMTLINSNIACTALCYDGTKFITSYQEYYWFNGQQLLSVTQIASISDLNTFSTKNLMSRKLLATPIVKTNLKTMKVIYEFQFI